MGLASALSTALTGLNAAETTIDVVGNNVANANTVGFKASEAVFATQFLQTQGLGSAPTANRGGTNPRQTGLGTNVAEITPDFTQGTIEISSNPSDLAIQGDGFFVVQGGQGEQLYTRNGQFKTNSQNELVTINGQRLLGLGVNDNFEIEESQLLESLVIPFGTAAVAQATQNVFLEGTFTPTGVVATQGEVIQSAVLSDGSRENPATQPATTINTVVSPGTTLSGAAAATTGGSVGPGTYRYRVAFVDAFGNETPSATVPGSVTVAAGQDTINLTNLPIAAAPYSTLNIYRTDATGAGDYFFAGSSNTGSFVDTTNDTGLGAQLDTATLDPANYSYYVTFFDTGTGLETRPSALIGPESIGVSDRRIMLSDIPQPTPGGDFNAVRIYRNLASDDDVFHRLVDLLGGETAYIDGAADADISGNPQINLDGPPISLGMALTNVTVREGSTYSNPFEVGTLEFTGRKGGRTLATKQMEVTATTTVAELIDFLEESLGIVDSPAVPGNAGGSINSSTIELAGNRGEDNAVAVGLSSLQLVTASGTSSISLGFGSTQSANGESGVTDFVVFDSLGTPLNVRVTAVLESRDGSSTTYRWFADSSDNDPETGTRVAVGTGTVTFDGEGSVVAVSNSTISVERENVSSSSPLEFDLDFSQISGLAADQTTVAASRQDGSAAGTLSSYIIGEDGRIRGVFTNGVTRDLGQVRIATFANNAGLEQRGENLFASGVNSGLPVVGNPGEGGAGTVVSGAVELSNTDIGENLVSLILASTQYRGNARVITAAQQLLDELLNLRR